MWKFEVRVSLFVVLALLGLSLTATATAFGIKVLLEEVINQSGTMKPLKLKIPEINHAQKKLLKINFGFNR